MKKIRISSDALADLNEGFLFYEQQELGLGDCTNRYGGKSTWRLEFAHN